MDINNNQSLDSHKVITVKTWSVNSNKFLKLKLKKIEVIFEGLFIDRLFCLLSPVNLRPIQNTLTRIV